VCWINFLKLMVSSYSFGNSFKRKQSIWIRSDEGLTLETPAFNLFTTGGQLTLSTQLVSPKFNLCFTFGKLWPNNKKMPQHCPWSRVSPRVLRIFYFSQKNKKTIHVLWLMIKEFLNRFAPKAVMREPRCVYTATSARFSWWQKRCLAGDCKRRFLYVHV